MADQPETFKDKFGNAVGKFSGSRFVRAIMAAGYSVITFSIIGAIFLILTVLPQALPIPGFATWYAGTIGRFTNMFQVIYNSTMGILALVFSGTFTYTYTQIYHEEENIDVVPVDGLMMFLMAMFITVPQLVWKNGSVQFVQSLNKLNIIGGGYAVSTGGITRIASVGIFTGLVVGWLTVQIYRFTIKHNWRIKMPDSVPAGVANSFSALIPGVCVAFVVGAINLALVIAGTDIFKVLYIPFSFISNIADTWWGFLVIIFLIHLLWWFGIHGAAIMSSFYTPIVLANMAANVNGANHFFAGDPMNAFVIIGGSGATLGMAIWLSFRAKSAQLSSIGKVEIVPAIFNINEPILFGLPIVYNVQLAIPFICAPLVSGIVGYIAVTTGLVHKIILQQPWPTPVGLSGFLATASWEGAILSIFCAFVAFLVWYPFIRHYDRTILKKEQAATAAEK
ncbi:PTS cellobiose transporter subunit IIC [Pediococcus ethanolidurans]|uniref:PTS cellobiose transporter subunit IIC n=1 Tax=Pediococcus ethanolidurans TaxID=319653 RepID=UPI001C1E9FA2|nr:PTS cellobiose transporter subunit IIC [Pediococcus ethanolidurans]MBU7555935.1 PTS cellobiose transporter subunit IIC [Pediococcus ethanolidurans]MCV3316419.1 PTS cellobiose transporter subunit IIC [Pediococcus ethanolidurans]MCV3322611.1 PTS cellobiose transporter subunit IIC [Pediococcus ethanolidurans]MCV3324679.1 PTS cellobiose transporter subunit IIC [Pediococcus ethanolidurans]MCV3328646.1 PTS cellobiose transporter subunit IIC [Pediococcus ethanolidurans]